MTFVIFFLLSSAEEGSDRAALVALILQTWSTHHDTIFPHFSRMLFSFSKTLGRPLKKEFF